MKKASNISRNYFAITRDYSKIIETEAAFFKGLTDAKDKVPCNQSVHKAIRDATSFIQESSKPLTVCVEFEVHDVRANCPRTIYLGTQLTPPNGVNCPQITHFICLAEGKTLLAKFHSDFDFDSGAHEKKPSPHAHVGGRVPPQLAARYSECRWDEQIDKPRLPVIPLCTPLLWHWIFREFEQSEQCIPFIKSVWWNKLVKDAEFAILCPFFEDGAAFLKRDAPKGFINSLYSPVAK